MKIESPFAKVSVSPLFSIVPAPSRTTIDPKLSLSTFNVVEPFNVVSYVVNKSHVANMTVFASPSVV